MFSLLYYPGILPRVLWNVNRFLQENFNIFCKNLLTFKELLLIELGEGSLVRTVHETVQHRANQTADDKYGPDQPVVAVCHHQQEADQILSQRREQGIDHAGDTADSASVGGRDTTGVVGIAAQHGDNLS